MSIRIKLLLLLLAFAVIPIGAVAGIGWLLRGDMVARLGAEARMEVEEKVGQLLLTIAQDHAMLFERERRGFEAMITSQAREVERLLAGGTGVDPTIYPVYFAESFDTGIGLPPDAGPDPIIVGGGEDRTAPALTSRGHQVFFIPDGVERSAVEHQIEALTPMSGVYPWLRRAFDDLVVWQYTGLASGLHSVYPGHGGFPEDFDPRHRPWYELAVASAARRAENAEPNAMVMAAPNIDATSGYAMLPLSMVLHDAEGGFLGVTSIDVRIDHLISQVRLPDSMSEDAGAFIVTVNSPAGLEGIGTPTQDHRLFVLASNRLGAFTEEFPMDDSGTGRNFLYDPARAESMFLTSDNEAKIQTIARSLLEGGAGIARMNYEGTDSLWAYASLGANANHSGAVILVVPYKTAVADAVRAESLVVSTLGRQFQIALFTGGAALLVTLVVVLVASRTVTRPIRRLADAAHAIAQGELDTTVNIRTGDELETLGTAFNEMVPGLRERLRMSNDLRIAQNVQQALLPSEPPSIDGLDIFGASYYCDETGGDYYDFITGHNGPDSRELVVAVGDVTGHGISAALTMTTARSLLRTLIAREPTLPEVVSAMNIAMFADAPDGRFMTMCLMRIDPTTRRLAWVSAGHDPPMLVDPARGTVEDIGTGSLPLAVIDDGTYDEDTLEELRPDQFLLIGTDGIWEARSPEGELFGKERLRQLLLTHTDSSATEIGNDIVKAIHEHCGPAHAGDDITLVVIRTTPHARR